MLGAPPAAAGPDRADGLLLPVGGGHLKVAFCADDVVRVAFARDPAFFDRPSLAAGVRRCEPVRVERTDAGGKATLSTPKMKVRVDLGTGRVAFLDAQGAAGPRREGGRAVARPRRGAGRADLPRPAGVGRERGEALYGLGQHQLGLLDIKGYDLDLWQHNATVVVPFLVSSRGYGILWDNTSFTRFGDLRPWEPIPPARLFDATGQPGGLTGSYFAGAGFETARRDARRPRDRDRDARRDEAAEPAHPPRAAAGGRDQRPLGGRRSSAAETGDHLFQLYSNSGIRLWVDGRLVVDHWRQGWLPWIDVARVPPREGRGATA